MAKKESDPKHSKSEQMYLIDITPEELKDEKVSVKESKD